MRPCTPINHRTPPRESAVKPAPHPAAPVGNPSQTRRHHLSSTPVQQLCICVQSCGQKRSFLLDRAIAQPLAALPLTDAAYPLRVRPVFFSARRKRGPRRAPRGGERRSAQAHEVGAEVPLGCKGAGAVFAAGGNGA